MQANKDQSFFLPFPPQVQDFDSVSPYKICIVILVKEYLRKRDQNAQISDESNSENEKLLVPSLAYSSDYRKQFYMLLLKLIQIPDMSYKDLHTMLSHKINSSHFEGFQNIMSIAMKIGVEILYELNKKIDEIISDAAMTGTNSPALHQSSIVGLFLRRVLVHLERMSFQEMMELYKSFCTYYEKGRRAIEISAPLSMESFGTIMEEMDVPNKKWSSKQAEIFINQQMSLLENDETKALNPKELQQKIDEIARIYNPLHSKVYFLSYLNNLRVRDLPNCIEALHRTFDRNAEKYSQNPTQHDNASKSNFQYSLLNLAILHTLFDHNEEALKCLKECIMIAQENGDRVCLQLAQLWFCLLDNSNFHLSEKTIANKTEISLVRSVSHNIQSLVKVAALSGEFS